MDMTDVIEQLLIEECIKDFANSLTNLYKYDILYKENIYSMQCLMDEFLSSLSKDFIYDYDVYTDGSRVKFQFNIKRRFLYGFLG